LRYGRSRRYAAFVIILLFGPPGCGKGTQASFLVDHLRIPAISTGEMFRAECLAGTALGNRARALLARGELVGDEIVNAMVADRIARPDCAGGFLLDGYPRTVAQARYFSGLLRQRELPEPLVIHLDVPAESLVRRLTARRQCPQCHRIYNLLSQPPIAVGVCDADGTALVTREDDRESVIRDRLRAYHDQTGPVLEWYGPSHVQRVDGSLPAVEVTAAIEAALACSCVAAVR
jgi:adenylate kinase